MHQDELDDWAQFGEVRATYEKNLKDPDDVFLDAEERKQELRKGTVKSVSDRRPTKAAQEKSKY